MDQTTNDGVTRILNLEERADATLALEKLRRNITVLFTDIKGSTAYFEKFGDSAGLLMVHHCNTMIGKIVEQHGGRVIKTIGDAVMASFEEPAEAVAASMEMQEAITADSAAKPEARRVKVRIGINFGLGFVKSNDVFGDVVNVASRVEGAAVPEQILISDTLHQEVAPSGRFRLRLAGRFSLKGKSEERNLYEVIWREGVTDEAFNSMIGLSTVQAKFKLVQLRSDRQPGREFEFSNAQGLIGRTEGHFTFPNDEYLQPVHACFTIESGQLFLEPLPDADTYFSLIASYRLQQGDVVSFGSQVLEFRVDEAALAEAAATGSGLGTLLHGNVAEFISLNPDGRHYAIRDEQTTFGRTKATYTFPTDTAMSRAHAKVYYRGEDFFLEDTGSTNGTFVLARDRTPIPPGAVLSLGSQRLKIVREEAQGKSVQVG
jgi:class 3 adenylate cyclase